MASILSLPDEVIDIIGHFTEWHVGIKAWCRLTSTCKRLWRMQLPRSRRGWEFDSETTIEGKLQERRFEIGGNCSKSHVCCSMDSD